jgi:hypothetical protein
LYPTRERLDGDSAVRGVDEADPERGVELGLVLPLRLSEDVHDEHHQHSHGLGVSLVRVPSGTQVVRGI